MSDRSDGIDLLAPLVGNDEAVRLWAAFREWVDPADRVDNVKNEFVSALRAWLIVRGHETERETALGIVEDTISLMSALEFLTAERYSWIEFWMRGALDDVRAQHAPD